MKKLWQALVRFTERFGQIISRVVLTLLYFFLVGPVGIFFSLVRGGLEAEEAPDSTWLPSPPSNESLSEARRQS